MKKGPKKDAYFSNLKQLFMDHSAIFVVNIENVTSQQMQQVRKNIYQIGGEILMGKNTMIRTGMRSILEDLPEIEPLIKHVKGNVGFVFSKSNDLKGMREKILENRVKAPARAGALAPIDVTIPAGNTGMEPGKTSFFQALGVPTKIARGTIEIINDVHLVKAGCKVGSSEATLLNMLNISPFTYGLSIECIMENGALFKPELLDIDNATIEGYVRDTITQIAALSLETGVTSIASVPHLIFNNYKNLLALSIESDYTFEGSQKVKDMLANPEAFAAPAAQENTAQAAGSQSKKEEVKEEPEESDDDMGFGLFD